MESWRGCLSAQGHVTNLTAIYDSSLESMSMSLKSNYNIQHFYSFGPLIL